jgi:uncharacterized membrane protein
MRAKNDRIHALHNSSGVKLIVIRGWSLLFMMINLEGAFHWLHFMFIFIAEEANNTLMFRFFKTVALSVYNKLASLSSLRSVSPLALKGR